MRLLLFFKSNRKEEAILVLIPRLPGMSCEDVNFVKNCSNLSTLSKFSPTCLELFELIQTFPNLSKHVQNRLNIVEFVQTCSNLFKFVPILECYFNLSKLNKLAQIGSKEFKFVQNGSKS